MPAESFRATELADIRERPTRPEALEHDEDEEEVDAIMASARLDASLRERTKERDAARATVLELGEEVENVRARLRLAIGLLNDVDRLSANVSAFLDCEVKR